MYTADHFIKAQSLQEAWQLNQNPKNTILGGGMWLRLGSAHYDSIIDLEQLGLNQIEEKENEFRIGCMVSERTWEKSESLKAAFGPCIAASVHAIVGTQFRNTATIGGSVAGRYGFSDLVTCLLALDASVELYQGGRLAIREFLEGNGLGRDLLLAVLIPKQEILVSYHAVHKTKTDFPLISCAMNQRDSILQAVIGARPGRAVLIANTENLPAAAFADWAAEQTSYGDDLRCGSEYRKVLAQTALAQCAADLLKGGCAE